ncbi:MAG: fluoride efflux transporter CrcB [Paludibacteraceae bacterium]|jgi:CrcB protein|nr:fluoride efflux transporter CrcB [Paludibacteraceae bacterium]
MKQLLIVMLGSGLGGGLRYLLTMVIGRLIPLSFPFGTMGVNLLGCLLIGLFYGLATKGMMDPTLKLFLTTGLCGGLTTFSTFMNENLQLLRDDNLFYFALYAGLSVALGLTMVYVGNLLVKIA